MGSSGDFHVGQSESITRSFSREDVLAFAELSGDTNPIHLDSEYAATTRFKSCIVHGTFYTGILGTIIGTTLPGPGTILLYQEHNFFKPVYVGESITARVEITEIKYEKKIITLALTC